METWLGRSDQLGGLMAEWVASPDCCELCDFMDGRLAPVGGGWTGGFTKVGKRTVEVPGAAYPPLHPNCRCAMGLAVAPGATPPAEDVMPEEEA
jgi:hypothetical protein